MRFFLTLLFVLALSIPVAAQQVPKVPRIGYLTIGYAPTEARRAPLREAFLQGLRELGYVEGKNILIEYRYAEGKSERFPDLAAELVHLKVNIIVANVTAAALAAKKATRTIPIITVTSADPVGSGPRRQPGPSWWKRYGAKFAPRSRDEWQTA